MTSTISALVYIEILDNFLTPSIEDLFGDYEVIFQNDNATCHRAKGIKDFLWERFIKSMTWPVDSQNLNPAEYVWWKIFYMVRGKVLFTKIY